MKRKARIHLVDIQKKVQTQDPETGALSVTWVNVYDDVDASIEPLSVRAYMQSKAEQSDVSVRVEIGWLPGLDASMRIKATCYCHAGRIYNPAGLLEDTETGQEYITFPCSQGVNEG